MLQFGGTGTTLSGAAAAGLKLGDASQMAWCGRPTLTDGQWINFFTPALSTNLHVYALSEELTVPWSAATVAGDYNGDGYVNAADYPVWRNTNGQSTIGPADGNNDGRITLADYTRWKERYGDAVGEAGLGSGTSSKTRTGFRPQAVRTVA